MPLVPERALAAGAGGGEHGAMAGARGDDQQSPRGLPAAGLEQTGRAELRAVDRGPTAGGDLPVGVPVAWVETGQVERGPIEGGEGGAGYEGLVDSGQGRQSTKSLWRRGSGEVAGVRAWLTGQGEKFGGGQPPFLQDWLHLDTSTSAAGGHQLGSSSCRDAAKIDGDTP